MFNGNYPFFSGSSKRMTLHFEDLAREAMANYLSSADPFVVEIGSNDGVMLQHFAHAGIRHLGVEPSANVARMAGGRGIQTVSAFFNSNLAHQIVKDHGQADVIMGANVLCHISDLPSVAEGIRILLKPGGIALFEDPYLGDVLRKTSYDQFYDEHVFVFSISSLHYLFQKYGLEIVDVRPQETHGGSMRVYLTHQDSRAISSNVSRVMEQEKKLEFDRPETYDRFRKRCEGSRNKLRSLLKRLRSEGKRVVGYGATSKSTTVTNYCGITPELVEFICDTTLLKQGKYSPGTHIPIRPHEEFLKNYPGYALLFAWNHRDEIMEKEKKFQEEGGQWIVYVPEVEVLAPFRESSLKN